MSAVGAEITDLKKNVGKSKQWPDARDRRRPRDLC